jgi:hypothetical protein
MRDLLALPADALALPGAAWGSAFADGHVVQPPVVLFPRIDVTSV